MNCENKQAPKGTGYEVSQRCDLSPLTVGEEEENYNIQQSECKENG